MEKSLKLGILYNFADLLKSGYIFGRLKLNRELNPKNIAAKKQSIKELKGTVSPIIVTTAKKAIENGLEVLDDKGIDVTAETKNLEQILVTIEGQHRVEALKSLLTDGGIPLSAFVMLVTVNASLPKILQEANNSVCIWNGIDWLTSLAVCAEEKNVPISAISFVKELKSKPDMSDSAAWLWAKGEIISKSKITNLIKKPDTGNIKQMTDDANIEMRRELYDKTHAKLGGKLAGVKIIPSTLLTYQKQLIDKDVVSSEAWQCIIMFIENLDEDMVSKLQKAKVGDGHTKDQNITLILNEAWDAYCSKFKHPDK